MRYKQCVIVDTGGAKWVGDGLNRTGRGMARHLQTFLFISDSFVHLFLLSFIGPCSNMNVVPICARCSTRPT